MPHQQSVDSQQQRAQWKSSSGILHIQCKPSTSIPFWQAIGFELRPSDDGTNCALRYMPRKLELPEGGTPVQVLVEWYPEQRKWAPFTSAVRTQAVPDVLLENEVHLESRALSANDEAERDLVVRVCVDGQEWYCDKAKYAAADELGVERCRNGFCIDGLRRAE